MWVYLSFIENIFVDVGGPVVVLFFLFNIYIYIFCVCFSWKLIFFYRFPNLLLTNATNQKKDDQKDNQVLRYKMCCSMLNNWLNRTSFHVISTINSIICSNFFSRLPLFLSLSLPFFFNIPCLFFYWQTIEYKRSINVWLFQTLLLTNTNNVIYTSCA